MDTITEKREPMSELIYKTVKLWEEQTEQMEDELEIYQEFYDAWRHKHNGMLAGKQWTNNRERFAKALKAVEALYEP